MRLYQRLIELRNKIKKEQILFAYEIFLVVDFIFIPILVREQIDRGSWTNVVVLCFMLFAFLGGYCYFRLKDKYE